MAKEIKDYDLSQQYEVAVRDLAQTIYLEDSDSISKFIDMMSKKHWAYKALYVSFRARTQEMISDDEFSAVFPFSEDEISIKKYTCCRKNDSKYEILVIDLPPVGLNAEYDKIYYIYDDTFTAAFGGFRTLEETGGSELEGIFIYKNQLEEVSAGFTVREYIHVNKWVYENTGNNANIVSSKSSSDEHEDLYKIMCALMNDTDPGNFSIKADEDSI